MIDEEIELIYKKKQANKEIEFEIQKCLNSNKISKESNLKIKKEINTKEDFFIFLDCLDENIEAANNYINDILADNELKKSVEVYQKIRENIVDNFQKKQKKQKKGYKIK